MKKVLIATTICTAMLASCGQNSAEYKKLKAENDSLRIENTKSNAEMDEILGTLNDVEADIQSIRDAENYLNIQQQKGDLNKSNREQIKAPHKLPINRPQSNDDIRKSLLLVETLRGAEAYVETPSLR